MGWSTSEPSGVTWGSSVEASKTWNHWKLELTAYAGRKSGGGDTFYLKVKAVWKNGSQNDYQNQPGFYWNCTSGTGDGKEKFYNRPDNPATQWRYYTGTKTGAADTVTVKLSYTSNYTSDTTLTVKPALAAASYLVSYNANGGSGSVASQTKTYGASFTTASGSPLSKTGYTFNGWNTAANGTGTAYAANMVYPSFPNSAVTLYAQWTANTYTVAYDANGGEGAPASQTKTYNVNLTLSSIAPTRSGYFFNNWNTASDGSGTSYSPEGTYSANAAATLYAQWSLTETDPYVYVNVSGTVHQIKKAYANVGGSIKECDVYVNVGGTIKKI